MFQIFIQISILLIIPDSSGDFSNVGFPEVLDWLLIWLTKFGKKVTKSKVDFQFKCEILIRRNFRKSSKIRSL